MKGIETSWTYSSRKNIQRLEAEYPPGPRSWPVDHRGADSEMIYLKNVPSSRPDTEQPAVDGRAFSTLNFRLSCLTIYKWVVSGFKDNKQKENGNIEQHTKY